MAVGVHPQAFALFLFKALPEMKEGEHEKRKIPQERDPGGGVAAAFEATAGDVEASNESRGLRELKHHQHPHD